ncbi:hypothetical protein P3T43_004437 [Paraburkholderia sp. GAS41]
MKSGQGPWGRVLPDERRLFYAIGARLPQLRQIRRVHLALTRRMRALLANHAAGERSARAVLRKCVGIGGVAMHDDRTLCH